MASRLIEPDRLDLEAPGWSRDIPRTAGELRTIQFSSLPPESELDQLGAFIERHPEVAIRAYGGYDGSITDVEFLRHFRGARRVAIDALFELESLEGLRYLSDDLESLVLGRTRRRFSMGPLGRFRRLRSLYVEGHSKDIEVVSGLADLQDVTFRSLTLPNLEILVPLRKLRALDIKLGGTTDLRPLSDMKQIEYLELWMIRGFTDLSEVSGLMRLRYLFLQALKQVTSLPDFSPCARLERIHLQTMRGLTDLRPLRGVRASRPRSHRHAAASLGALRTVGGPPNAAIAPYRHGEQEAQCGVPCAARIPRHGGSQRRAPPALAQRTRLDPTSGSRPAGPRRAAGVPTRCAGRS